MAGRHAPDSAAESQPKLEAHGDYVAACGIMKLVGIKKTRFYDYRKQGYFKPSFLTPGGRPRYYVPRILDEVAAVSAAIEAAKTAKRPRRGRPPLKFNVPLLPPRDEDR